MTPASDQHSGVCSAAGLRAVVLAGGKGTRLMPFTASFPKPLVPLGDKPVLEVLLEWLSSYGISDVTLTLGHLAELVKAYFTHRAALAKRFHLQFVIEDEPSGTAGSLALVDSLDDTFLVMNGDLLTDLDLNALVQFHRNQRALLTIATHSRQVTIDLGVLHLDDKLRVTEYIEKPEFAYQVSMGIYVYEPRVLKFIKRGQYLDFPALVNRLLAAGEKVSAFPANCLWLDIGRPDDYAKAQQMHEARFATTENV